MSKVITPKRLFVAFLILLVVDFVLSIVFTGAYKYPLQILDAGGFGIFGGDVFYVYGAFVLLPFYWWRHRSDKKQITVGDIEGAVETTDYSVTLVLSSLIVYLLARYGIGRVLDIIFPNAFPAASSLFYGWLLAFPVGMIFYVVVDKIRREKR